MNKKKMIIVVLIFFVLIGPLAMTSYLFEMYFYDNGFANRLLFLSKSSKYPKFCIVINMSEYDFFMVNISSSEEKRILEFVDLNEKNQELYDTLDPISRQGTSRVVEGSWRKMMKTIRSKK